MAIQAWHEPKHLTVSYQSWPAGKSLTMLKCFMVQKRCLLVALLQSKYLEADWVKEAAAKARANKTSSVRIRCTWWVG